LFGLDTKQIPVIGRFVSPIAVNIYKIILEEKKIHKTIVRGKNRLKFKQKQKWLLLALSVLPKMTHQIDYDW
jgi:hypothetical protein